MKRLDKRDESSSLHFATNLTEKLSRGLRRWHFTAKVSKGLTKVDLFIWFISYDLSSANRKNANLSNASEEPRLYKSNSTVVNHTWTSINIKIVRELDRLSPIRKFQERGETTPGLSPGTRVEGGPLKPPNLLRIVSKVHSQLMRITKLSWLGFWDWLSKQSWAHFGSLLLIQMGS